MVLVSDRPTATIDAGWGDHSNYDKMVAVGLDRAVDRLPDKKPGLLALGDCRTPGYSQREHTPREVALARTVAIGCDEVGQSIIRPEILERAVHAAADFGKQRHHLAQALENLAKRQPPTL